MAEGDDGRLIRVLAKSAEELSIVRVHGDLVKVWFRDSVIIAMTGCKILERVLLVTGAMRGHHVGQGVIWQLRGIIPKIGSIG